MMRWIAGLATLLGLGVCGCGAGSRGRDFDCTASIEPAVVARVTDAATGASIASGATVVVTDGDYTETLHEQESILNADGSFTVVSYGGASERAGTYTVRVTRDGYRPAERTGIRATRNDCHVNTQQIGIALTPVTGL